MPHVKHRAQRRARVARRRLHEDVFPAPAALQGLDQQRVVEQIRRRAHRFSPSPASVSTVSSIAFCKPRAIDGRKRRGNFRAVRESQPVEKFRAESAARLAVAVEERRDRAARESDRISRNSGAKRSSPEAESHCTLCSSAPARKPSSSRHRAIQAAERIGIIPLLLELQLISAGAASARRSENRRRDRASARSLVRTATRKTPKPRGRGDAPPPRFRCWETDRAARDETATSGPRANGRAIATQSTCSRVAPARRRHSSMAACGIAPGAKLRVSLASSMAALQFAVLQDGAGRVAEQTAQSENHHLIYFDFLFDLRPGIFQAPRCD